MWSDKQINLPNAHFFRVLNLAFCCRKSFHSKAASPCETSAFSFLFFSRFQLVFAAAPLDLIWAVHCSVDGNHWKAEININFWRSYFVKMSWKAFHLVTSYCSAETICQSITSGILQGTLLWKDVRPLLFFFTGTMALLWFRS